MIIKCKDKKEFDKFNYTHRFVKVEKRILTNLFSKILKAKYVVDVKIMHEDTLIRSQILKELNHDNNI